MGNDIDLKVISSVTLRNFIVVDLNNDADSFGRLNFYYINSAPSIPHQQDFINSDGSVPRWDADHGSIRRDILLVYKDSHFNMIGPVLADVQPEQNGRLTDDSFAALLTKRNKAKRDVMEVG